MCYIIYAFFSLLFHFSLSQSIYTWGFGSDKVSPDGVAGAEPLRQSSRNPSPNHRARRAGRRSRRARRARASAGSASRAELEGGESWCKRHALKRGLVRIKRSPTVAGATPLHQSSTNLPSSTRARRAGRRSRRARRARASAGSASLAELEGGESWCKRHALKRGLVRMKRSPTGAGASSCEDLSSAHPKFFPFPIPHTGIRIQRMI